MSLTESTPIAADTPIKFAAQVRDILADLHQVKPWIYWVDFLVTSAVWYTCLWPLWVAVPGSPFWYAALVICSAASFRATVFTHEIAHRRPGQLKGFALAWNLLCGIPLLVPSFLYGDHRSHHVNKSYGTHHDAEYVFLHNRRVMRVMVFLLLPAAFPIFSLLRFLVLAPLAMVSRRLDKLIWKRASSLYFMNLRYLREYDASARTHVRWVQETGCCVWSWTFVGLFLSGAIPTNFAVSIYLMSVLWMFVNQVRTLIAHRYASHGEAMSYREQVLDSYTFPFGLLAEFWAPLGMRYHALHHVAPTLPYHAMAAAHCRFMRELPADSPYRATIQSTPWIALWNSIFSRSPLREGYAEGTPRDEHDSCDSRAERCEQRHPL